MAVQDLLSFGGAGVRQEIVALKSWLYIIRNKRVYLQERAGVFSVCQEVGDGVGDFDNLAMSTVVRYW